MKLLELRQLVNEYDQTWYFRKYVYGDHERAKKFKQYLQKYEHVQDDYELTVTDIFRLLKKVPELNDANSNLQFIRSIRASLNSSYLFDIFNVLKSAQVISQANFTIIYGLSHEWRCLLNTLFCGLTFERISLNSEILAAVLAIASRSAFYYPAIEQSLRFLHKKNHLTSTSLNLLTTKTDGLNTVFQIVQELDKANCLNDACLVHFAHRESLYSLDALIALLNRAKVTLNEELIQSICINSNIHYLVELITTLVESKEFHLKSETLIMLLKQDFKFFLNKNDAMKLLQENDLLDDKTFDFVCNNDDFSIKQILKILSEESLLTENKEIVNKLINKEFSGIRFYRTIDYLKKADLLDQKSLTNCFELILIKSNADLFKTGVLNVLELFHESSFNISKEQLETLFSLSDANLRRLHGIVSRLITSKLLDQPSLEKTFNRIMEKLPPVLDSTVNKNSKKNTSAPRSEYILDNENCFFIEHSTQYESGGFGKVKKGYNLPDSNEPIYGIKKLVESDPSKAQKEASREVKYHRLLGRQAFYFLRNGTTSIVSDWQREKGLHLYNASELLQMPIEKRLGCLKSGLADLNMLHQHYRVHGDVKCQNFILNPNNGSLNLIDFGTSHKKGSSKSFAWTPAYSDPHTFGDGFYKDIYAMGIVTMYLFPEIYAVSFNEGKANVSINKSDYTVTEQAIVNLVNSMMNSDISLRCTSGDALTYCNEVLEHFNQIDERFIETIANATINRAKSTVEDVFHM
ncbi:Protein kinase domain protein [Legionella moravica]|uniref:Protein kinase domain n=1 Tax=Legionella moravica TaxID=39962 RepID=A0A378K023_9GAMM|nr:protein kinase family protein [Legionella moravica]KTD31041.1 Protein kinase domain protein [Legionella moravica]STX63620.1 Protein kinase domain [Legionella moravica]